MLSFLGRGGSSLYPNAGTNSTSSSVLSDSNALFISRGASPSVWLGAAG
jgi:hypothetical protein